MYIERWMVSVVPYKLKFIKILVALVFHCEFSVVQKLHTSISLRTVNLIEMTAPLSTKKNLSLVITIICADTSKIY